jgi:hypothetical protein
MLTPDENYTYDNEKRKDDNNINEVALIDLSDNLDDMTNNAPLISSPISLDMLELDNEIFQQTFNSNAYVDSNEVKEVITEDLETLYDKIDDNDDKKRENSFKNDITNEDDITLLLSDEPKLTKLTFKASSKNNQINRKQQEIGQWILRVMNERNQKK